MKNEVNILSFGAKADGFTDDTLAFENALSSAQTVLIPDGIYVISRTLQLQPGCEIKGASWNTILTTSLDIPFFSNQHHTAEGVLISNIQLHNSFTQTTAYHIHLTDPANCIIDKVWMKSAFAEDSYHVANRGGIYFQQLNTGGFDNSVNDSLIEGGSIKIETTGSTVNHTYIWGYAVGTPAVEILASHVSIEHCDIVPSYNHGGIYLHHTNTGRVVDCSFDGNGTVKTGWGIIISGGDSHVITGNSFWGMFKGGIWITDSSLINISENDFQDNNMEDNGYADIRIQSIFFMISTITVSNNTFYITEDRKNKGNAIEETGSTPAVMPTGNSFSDNKILGYY